MPEIEVRGFDPDKPDGIVTIGVTETVLFYLAKLGYLVQPYPVDVYLEANIEAGRLAEGWERDPEDKPDPAD